MEQQELTRFDHLRMYALQRATTFLREGESAEGARERSVEDAKAYYAFLTENEGAPIA